MKQQTPHNLVRSLAIAAAGLTSCAAFADAPATATATDALYIALHQASSYSNKTSHVHYELAKTNIIDTLTAKQTGYPTDVVAPSFWLDCSDTTGWGFTTEGGKQVVTNIPSKAGSKWAGTRWLTTRPGGGDWVGWGSTLPNPPFFAHNETGALGNGGNYLDFSENTRALLFNTDGCGYNALTNIGTIVAIWGSDLRNGGHLLGGGATKPYGWHRAGDCVTSKDAWTSSYRWSAALMNGNAQAVAQGGTVWHDGNPTYPTLGSYNGGWEVLSFKATAATAEACGIGVNDKRSYMAWASGGQEVAELLIFDTLLSREDIEKLELYLGQKWFNRPYAGWNGKGRVAIVNAYGSDLQSEINVSAGETLEVDRLTGGSRSGSGATKPKMTKTGAGTLIFAGEGAQDYSAEIVLNEGAISFPAVKAVPTAAELPAHVYARFDPSAGTITTDADGKVVRWNNSVTSDDARRCAKPFSLQQNVAAQRPTLLVDEFGPGLHALDFGENITDTGNTMYFSTNTVEDVTEGVNNSIGLYGVQTVVAVVGAQYGGGTLLDASGFAREYPDSHNFHHKFIGANALWSNGKKWNPDKGFETEGYQVMAYQTKGNSFTALFRSESNYGGYPQGGGRVGEILMWNRALTEDEIMAAQAYLMAKWFKRVTPGFARPAAGFAATDLQDLTVPVGKRVELHVGAGRTVRIGNVTVVGELVKTGAGTVEVEQASYLYDGRITTEDGLVKAVGVRDVATASEMAPGASLHVDASDTNSFVKAKNGGDTVAKIWRGKGDAIGLWTSNNGYPESVSAAPVLSDAETLKGYQTVNFKPWGSYKWLSLDRPLHSMRAIYAVMKCHGRASYNSKGQLNVYSGGWLFGNGDGLSGDAGGTVFSWYPWRETDDISFHPGLTDGLWDGRLISGYNSGVFTSPDGCRTNGVSVGATTFKVATNVYQLIEFHANWGVAGGTVALDRENSDRSGGFAIAELVAYERPLSEREKVATRNYLMKKWFDAEPQALPDAPAKPEIRSYEIAVDGEATFDAAQDVEKVRVTGEGTLTKTGEGKLTVKDLSGFDGTVNVAEGTLEVLYADPYATPYLPTEGILYHADATKGITATTNDQNVICVSEWANQGSAPLKSVRSGGNYDYQKLVFDPDVGYKPTVDMNGYNACMTWQKSDGSSTEIQTLSGIKSIFWMIGSQNGGGFVMGGGTNSAGVLSHMWHRGIYTDADKKAWVGNTNICTVLNGNMQAAVKPPKASWWKNGETMGWSDYLSGKWDQLSMIVVDDTQDANASGFAYDGRSRKATGPTNHEYNGHQRLAEVICYDRRVTDEERQQIECYLRCKWNNNMHAVAANVVVNVAEGATLDLGDNAQAFEGIKGAGTVAGSVTVQSFLADAAATGFEVTGTLTVPANVTFALQGVTGKATVTVATAAAYAGTENLATATFTGVPAGYRAKAKIVEGALVVVVKPIQGVIFTIR